MVYLATATTVTQTNYNQPVVILVNTDSPYTADDTKEVIVCNCTSGAITINLPTAVGRQGAKYEIKKTDNSANAVTVDANGSQTIDGALTLVLYSQYDSYTIISDNANWVII